MDKKIKWKWSKWGLAVLISGVAIFLIIKLIPGIISPPKPPGCYKFDNGTTQGWTLDQLYIAKPAPKTGGPQKKVMQIAFHPPYTPQPYTPFMLLNHKNIALEAYAPMYLILDNKVNLTDIYLESPDLSSDPNWQNIVGYSIDIRREFYNPCFGTKDCTAQLQLRVIDTSDNSPHLFAETEKTATGKTKFKFHEIKLNKPYHFVWKPSFLSNPKYKVKQVRIRLSMPGYHGVKECWFRGSWKIGNICPEK